MTAARQLVPWIKARLNRVLSIDWAPLNLLVSAGLATFFSLFLYISLGYGFRTRIFPIAVAVPGIAISAVLFFQQLAAMRRGETDPIPVAKLVEFRWKSIRVLGWILGLIIVSILVGFEIGTLVFTFAFYYRFGREPLLRSTIYTLLIWGPTMGLFIFILELPVPDGLLFTLLGL